MRVQSVWSRTHSVGALNLVSQNQPTRYGTAALSLSYNFGRPRRSFTINSYSDIATASKICVYLKFFFFLNITVTSRETLSALFQLLVNYYHLSFLTLNKL